MMLRIGTRTSIALALIIPAAVPARARPLEPQLPKDRAACYERTYDAAHLEAHPQQKVTRIRLIHPVEQGEGPMFVSLEFQLRRNTSIYKLFGYCEGKGGTLACAPEWAAGTWRIEVAPDGGLDVVNGNLTLNPENYDAEEIAPDAIAVPARPDDRRWRLYRQAADKPCTAN